MLTWDVDPVLLKIGFLQIRYYGLLFAAAFTIGFFLLRRFLKKKGQDPLMADSLLAYMVFGVLIGARLVHILFYNPGYYFSHPSEILKVWHGGIASHGAVLGGIVATAVFCYRHKQNFWDIGDSISIQFILVAGFVRLGNFFNSEIVGRVTDIPWAVKFVRYDNNLPVDQVPWRHPTQIYEFIYHLFGFFLVSYIYARWGDRLKTGSIIFITISYYTFARFMVEFFKEYQTLQSGLTMGQWLSIPLFIVSVMLFMWRQKAGKCIH